MSIFNGVEGELRGGRLLEGDGVAIERRAEPERLPDDSKALRHRLQEANR